jgi:hypothetical protein
MRWSRDEFFLMVRLYAGGDINYEMRLVKQTVRRPTIRANMSKTNENNMNRINIKKTNINKTNISKINKTSKPKSKKGKITKSQSKSTKNKIFKLNSSVDEINEIKQLLGSSVDKKAMNVLDTKSLKEDLKKDEETKLNKRELNNDLTAQLDMLMGMGL